MLDNPMGGTDPMTGAGSVPRSPGAMGAAPHCEGYNGGGSAPPPSFYQDMKLGGDDGQGHTVQQGGDDGMRRQTAEAFAYVLQIGANGVVTGTDAQSLTGSAASTLSANDAVVSHAIYAQVNEGLNAGLQYRFVFGDLVCDGFNLPSLRRRCEQRINDAMRLAVRFIRVRVLGEDLTVIIQTGDIALITLALQLGECFPVRDENHGLRMLQGPEVRTVAQQILATMAQIRLIHSDSLGRIQSLTDANEIITATERAVKRIEEA